MEGGASPTSSENPTEVAKGRMPLDGRPPFLFFIRRKWHERS